MPRQVVKTGLYKRREKGPTGAFVRVERMGLGSCSQRTYDTVGADLGIPTAEELKGKVYTNANGLEIQYFRSGSVHGKTVVMYNSSPTAQAGDKDNYHMQIPDDQALGFLLIHISGLGSFPSFINQIGYLGGRKYPVELATPPAP